MRRRKVLNIFCRNNSARLTPREIYEKRRVFGKLRKRDEDFLEKLVVRAEQELGAPTFAEVSKGVQSSSAAAT